MRALITGGCGFFGHHFVEHLLKNTDWDIHIIDRLNYASKGFDRLRDIGAYDHRRVHRYTHDFIHPIVDGLAYELGKIDYIFHLGAETHVDNSIKDPRPFVYANVVGTMEMLEYARTLKKLKGFYYFSTDEVFGPANALHMAGDRPTRRILSIENEYCEWDRYNCTNPYAATKAGGEELCLAYANTYKLPMVITHCMNLFGERQHPEKFIPLIMRKVLVGDKVIIHANPSKDKAGSRFYIHARNAADAVLFLVNHLHHVQLRDKYNIVGQEEVDNLTLAKSIAQIMGKSLVYELTDFHSSRPGHDLRYSLDGSKMASLGWRPPVDFHDSLERTVRWTLDNKRWLR